MTYFKHCIFSIVEVLYKSDELIYTAGKPRGIIRFKHFSS